MPTPPFPPRIMLLLLLLMPIPIRRRRRRRRLLLRRTRRRRRPRSPSRMPTPKRWQPTLLLLLIPPLPTERCDRRVAVLIRRPTADRGEVRRGGRGAWVLVRVMLRRHTLRGHLVGRRDALAATGRGAALEGGGREWAALVRELLWPRAGVGAFEEAALVAELRVVELGRVEEEEEGARTTLPGDKLERRQVLVSVVQQLKHLLLTRSLSLVAASSVCTMVTGG